MQGFYTLQAHAFTANPPIFLLACNYWHGSPVTLNMRLPLLALHIIAGILGLLSGTVAMSFRKGSPGHRTAGNIFVLSMLIMGACAAYLAVLKHQPNNVFGGMLTFYLIATAWLTGRRSHGETSALDWGAMLFAVAIGASLLTLGVKVLTGHAQQQPGVPIGMYFFMGSIPLIAAAGDIRMLAHGGISGRPRLVRHLWRMCFGLFIATGSFFLGQQQVFPAAIRKQYLLGPAAILPLGMLIYWVIRVRFTRSGKRLIVSSYAENAGSRAPMEA
jgi:hypothetical protein